MPDKLKPPDRTEKMEWWLNKMALTADGVYEAAMWADWREQKQYVASLVTENKRLREALEYLKHANPLHHDWDDYLFNIADWGLGNRETRPTPEEFGVKGN